MKDPLAIVRGIVNGVGLSLLIWAAIFAVIYFGFQV